MTQSRAHILVVEDDPAILNGLCDVLVYNGYAADGVTDGGEGLTAALSGRYDMILLDVMLPTMDGFLICKQLRRKLPTLPVMMLTARGAEEDVIAGFKAGADDYVSKPFSIRELMVRVEAILRRSGRPVGDEIIECQGIIFDGRNLWARNETGQEALTRREMDIIVYLFRNRDRIVSKKELLVDVWHYADADIETRTVDIHMLKLRKKIMTLNAGATLLHTVRGEGYRMEA